MRKQHLLHAAISLKQSTILVTDFSLNFLIITAMRNNHISAHSSLFQLSCLLWITEEEVFPY